MVLLNVYLEADTKVLLCTKHVEALGASAACISTVDFISAIVQ